MLSPSRTCLACPEHCSRCHDPSPYGCDACDAFYSLQRGRCVFSPVYTVLSGIAAAALACCCCCCCCLCPGMRARCCCGCGGRVRQPSLRQSLRAAEQGEVSLQPGVPTAALPPSGVWRGYYTYEGRQHNLCEFMLRFATDGSIKGEGVDDVGCYAITGRWSGHSAGTEQIDFCKKYSRGTANHQGLVTEDNEGHSVGYRGAVVGQHIGAGFRGAWSIRNAGTHSDGAFHLWPAMQEWVEAQSQVVVDPVQALQGYRPTFKVAENGECIVCFDEPISTCLQPCGHIALCAPCAELLRGQGCPICRTSIAAVLHYHDESESASQGRPMAEQALRAE